MYIPQLPKGFEQLGDIIVPTGAIQMIIHDAATGRIKEVTYVKNMIVTAGKVSLAAGLFNSAKGMITYHANGTSAVAPALSDTALTTELARKLISVRSSSSNVFTAQTFFTVTESNGTIREMGLFGDDATSTANSGTLFCKAAVNRTKSSAETLTTSWTVTIA